MKCRLFVLTVLMSICACFVGDDPDSQPSKDPSSVVLAEDRLGPITLADIDTFILKQPPERRWRKDMTRVDWYTMIVKRIATDRLLFDKARAAGVEQEAAFAALERNILRNAYSNYHVRELALAHDAMSEDIIRSYFDDHSEDFDQPERRAVLHIFRRFANVQERSVILQEMETLLQRAQAGESFELLARQYSDSETRFNNGRLGIIKRGTYSEDLDDLIFSLERKTPSRVVETSDGVHIFFVETILEARSFSYEEARPLILREFKAQRLQTLLAEAAAALPQPAPVFRPPAHEIARIVQGDRQGLLLRVGEFSLSVAEFDRLLAERRRMMGARFEARMAGELLAELEYREMIYQHMKATGLPSLDAGDLDSEKRRHMVEYYAHQRMEDLVNEDEDRLRLHFDNNTMRFAAPIQVQLLRLETPLGDNPSARMARLESAREDLDAGRLSLADLAQELGGQVRKTDLVTVAQLQLMDPRALRFAFLIKTGEYSPPYRVRNSLVMFQVKERIEAIARPLDSVRDLVIQDYLNHNAVPVYQEMAAALHGESNLQIFDERFADIEPLSMAGL